MVVRYRTSPDAEALQWLAPAQTAGGAHPYLFSQGQAILTRTWIPTQDSPGIRQTYRARIVVPAPLRAVMSAEALTPDGTPVDGGRAFEFAPRAAGAAVPDRHRVGDIAFTPVGPRSGVYAEPSVVERAAAEFADIEKMIEAAEALGGPYRWGRYDVLVLPPSFPFGGMENPRVTFATPTILAGDRSLTSLIAHELAHSWSGNLVTNATWRDFWLNEGFTTYFENRIMEQLYGERRARMLEVLGPPRAGQRAGGAQGQARRPGPPHRPHRPQPRRRRDVDRVRQGRGVRADARGRGGPPRFDLLLRGYFDRHAFTSLTTGGVPRGPARAPGCGRCRLERSLQLDAWLEKPGLPANATTPASDAFALVERQVARFTGGAAAANLETTAWTTQEWQHFLGSLPAAMSAAQLADLDRAFRFSASGNSEVLFAWLRIAIRHRYQPAMPALERFLTSQGRRKFLKPLYEDLMATDWGAAEAKRLYAVARPTYHAVATTTLDAIVGR